jgi:glycosyltransferase involved in cell wall biosynthesis
MARLVVDARARGDDCWVLSVSGLGAVADQLQAAGVPVLACSLPGSAVGGIRRALAFARAFAPDVVHGWMYHGNLLAAFLARRLKAPLLWDVRHSIDRLADEKFATRWVIRASGWPIWRPNVVVFNSHAGSQSHESLGYLRWTCEVIPNGVDAERFTGTDRSSARTRIGISEAPDNASVIAWVARDHPMKDLDNFAAAAARVAEQVTDTRLVFVGRGMDAENGNITATLRRHGVLERSLLLGERDDLAKLYPAFDVLLVASRYGEGTPNVLLEALASGVPCVTTDVGDAARIVGDARWVVARQDPAGLADATVRVLGLSAEQKAQLVALNRDHVLHDYSVAGCFAAYRAVYDRLSGTPRD